MQAPHMLPGSIELKTYPFSSCAQDVCTSAVCSSPRSTQKTVRTVYHCVYALSMSKTRGRRGNQGVRVGTVDRGERSVRVVIPTARRDDLFERSSWRRKPF